MASSYYERDFDLEYSYERTRNIGAMLRHKLTDRDEITFDFEKMVRRNNRGHTIPEMRADVAGTYNGLTLKKNDYLPYFGMDFLNENGYINGRGNYWWGERHIEQYGVKWTHRLSDTGKSFQRAQEWKNLDFIVQTHSTMCCSCFFTSRPQPPGQC